MPLRSKQSAKSLTSPLRETLFGDMPLAEWAADSQGEPWGTLARAVARLGQKDQPGAIELLRSVLAQPEIESRHYLEAWSVLRELGVAPAGREAKHVYGVIVDVPVKSGFDTLAAYEDRSARYLNYSGAAIVWEAPDARMDRHVQRLLAAGQELAGMIGPWDEPRPELSPGEARISLLTPSGLHFGQAPFATLAEDEMAAPIINAATALMQALIALTETAPGN
jgi:hypothetical protein